jgi:prephenate dehydrogenase
MRTVVIVGTGLLGSSFGLAVKKARLFDCVVGVSSPRVVEKAIAVGAVDAAMTLEEALPAADLVLLAQPVKRILSLIERLDEHLRPGTLVTDVGSTKAEICAAGAKFISRAKFVGGHPMAGREVRGPEGASAQLFEGRPWVLTDPDSSLISIVEAIGGKPVFLGPEEHDRIVALSSHLPQLLSTALGSYLSDKNATAVSGTGLRDMTRLALSSFDLWQDILETNAANVDGALAGLIAELQGLRGALGAGTAGDYFERGARLSGGLRQGQ